MMIDLTFLSALGVAFLVSYLLSRMIIRVFANRETSQSLLDDVSATQSNHERPTPRIGGVAVTFGFLAGFVIWALGDERALFEIQVAIASGSLIFIIGLIEDIKRNVSARARLFGAIISALIAMYFTGIGVTRLGLNVTDPAFEYFTVVLLVTLLWSAGFCNAVNLSDGLNGLSSSFLIASLIGLMIIASFSGAPDLIGVSALICAALFGFFILNWPNGRIFLGDAGAYFLGHLVAWITFILMHIDEMIAPFAILLVLFWPVADMLFALIRRQIFRRSGHAPDRMHIHHLAFRFISRRFAKDLSRTHANSLTTLAIAPFHILPIIVGVSLRNDPLMAFYALVFFSLLFILTYLFLLYKYTKGRRMTVYHQRNKA